MSGFREHFHEARAVNRERRKLYADLTNGKSLFVSNILVWSEFLLYPVAWYFDIRAKKFNKIGISVISNDFVSLGNLPDLNEKPTYRNILTKNDLRDISQKMKRLRKGTRVELKQFRFYEVNKLIAASIVEIESIQTQREVHIAMLKHILESAAFAAKNAIEHSTLNNYKLNRLAAHFISAQLLGTILSPRIDKAANRIHRIGYGIVVNDLPEIPYKI